jgi:hypothetical protein
MDSNYQPPVLPGTTGASMSTAGGNGGGAPSPFFTTANQFLPRNLHDVIKWSRYITMQSPLTTEVIRKLSTYPITEFVPETKSERVKGKYKEVFTSFKLKQSLYDIGFEYYTIGNVFVSIYFPIQRSLTCQRCKTSFSAKNADFTQFKNYEFHGSCPTCGNKGTFIRTDTKSVNVADMNLIKWDPMNISVNNNPITGESDYYYKIPNDIKRRVQTGDKLFVNSVPWGFIEAIKNNQDFKFDSSHIFHLKNISAGHSINGIAVPPLISLFSLVYYQATLRKANEAIATDFMNPMRVVFPTAQTGNSDPVAAISMRNFVGHMQEAMLKHKRDKNHILIAPMPIGYQAISGEGKTLLVSQEIQQAEETILLSLGVSRELLSGVTNWQSSTVGLRLLQNTMDTYTTQMMDLVNWVMLHVSNYLGIEHCKVSMIPFKLTDDQALQQALIAMTAEGRASETTLFESFGLDFEADLEKRHKDAISKAVHEVETKFAVEQAVFLASREVTDRFDKDSDYRTSLAKAQGIAQQLYQADPMTQAQVLGDLKVTDYPQYMLVYSLLEEFMGQAQAAEDQAEGVAPNATGTPDSGKKEGSGSGAGPGQSAGPGPSKPNTDGKKPEAAKPKTEPKKETK